MIPPALAAQLAGGRAVAFSAFVDLALYDPVDGFYAAGGRAGRRGDFLTSPEVGPSVRRPGGPLARRHLGASSGAPIPSSWSRSAPGPAPWPARCGWPSPACAPALAYVLVERSAAQRALHAEHLPGWVGELDGERLDVVRAPSPGPGRGPPSRPRPSSPAALVGVVVANELLDNLAFDVVRRTADGRRAADGGRRGRRPRPAASSRPTAAVGAVLADLGVPPGRAGSRGSRRPGAGWPTRSAALERGRLLVVDYGAPTAELAARPEMGWLRTFRGHERGGHPLDDPGSQDITTDVAVDQLQLDHPATRVRTQAELAARARHRRARGRGPTDLGRAGPRPRRRGPRGPGAGCGRPRRSPIPTASGPSSPWSGTSALDG